MKTGLYISINESEFVRLFDEYNRSENFSHEGRRQLYDYLDQLSEDTGESIELDIIGLCCDFNECSVDYISKELGEDYTLKNLSDYTTVIGPFEVDGDERIIYGSF